MKQIILLIVISICSVFYCNAQNNIENSLFANIPISESLTPQRGISKKELKKIKNAPSYPSPGISYSIDFELRSDCFRLPNGKIATFFTASIENQELVFKDKESLPKAEVDFFGRVSSIDKKTNGIFEDKVNFSINTSNLKPIVYTDKQSYIKGVLLAAGDYQILFVVRDALNGKTGVRVLRFTVPNS